MVESMNRHIIRIANLLADILFAWFTPTWRRKGCEARSALVRYCNYHRPHISEERKEQLSAVLERLENALLFWKKEDTITATKDVEGLSESLRGFKRGAVIETVESLFEKRLDGFGEIFRAKSYEEIGAAALLSRATAGIYKKTVIFSMPGSPNAVKTAFSIIIDELPHFVHHVKK